MANFQIERYTVRVARNPSVPFTALSLSSSILTHGIQHTASLYFFPTYPALSGWARNVGGLNFDGIDILAQIPFDDFERFYQVLQTETPVWLVYHYGSSDTTTKPLTFVSIDSGEEPPGEGLADIDVIDALMQPISEGRRPDKDTSPAYQPDRSRSESVDRGETGPGNVNPDLK
jgi:hypothetical protein